MASKQQMTGMTGVYLLAAELTSRGFIVAPTSRSAVGADLLVTDESSWRAWTIQVKTNQVKTNGKPKQFWLLNRNYKQMVSDSHVYAFINLNGDERPSYYLVPSATVAKDAAQKIRPEKTWCSYPLGRAKAFHDNWSIFDDQSADPDSKRQRLRVKGR